MTGEKLGGERTSFAATHEAATLVDRTIDKPYSTSEAWLERYATLIETVLAESPALTPAVRAQVERYKRIVDGAAPEVNDAAFVAAQRQTERFLAALAEQNPTSTTLLRSGTRAELEKDIGPVAGNAGGAAGAAAAGRTLCANFDRDNPASLEGGARSEAGCRSAGSGAGL